MKRMLILVVIAMISGPLFAEEGVLIDFSLLKADIIPVENPRSTGPQFQQNRRTMMDFAHVAGGSFTQQQKDVMKTSLALENWQIILASSSRTLENVSLSYTREAPSKQFETVMGLRVRFPTEPHNAWALIKPPFDIPAFEPSATIGDDGKIESSNDGIIGRSRFESDEGSQPAYGVIKNVGIVKSVAVNVYGLNFPHGLSTILIDSSGNEKTVFMGFLQFDGWKELIWVNPAYVQEVRNRDIRLYPLYPTSTPFIKFGGFLIQRDGAKEGGDFITYFKDVKVIYDLAVLNTDRDIDDEGLWHIIQDRETARKVWEMERFGQSQVLRYLESQKQATEPPFGPNRDQQQQQ
jgi:hypothetical protein